MKRTLFLAIIAFQSSPALAGIRDLFKDEHGVRNWQHLANWTGGTLLTLLLIVTVYLFIARRKAYKANKELTAIRNELEMRVKERTATLDKSNRLLMESNRLLEDEISKHVITADQLRSSESYIKDILTSMPLMLVGLDKEGRVTHWNRQVEEVSGIPSEEALGKTLWEAYPQVTVLPEHVLGGMTTDEIVNFEPYNRGSATIGTGPFRFAEWRAVCRGAALLVGSTETDDRLAADQRWPGWVGERRID